MKKNVLIILCIAMAAVLIATSIGILLVIDEHKNKRLDAEAITLKETKIEFGKEVKLSDMIGELKGELLENPQINTQVLGKVQVPVHFKNTKNRKRKVEVTFEIIDVTPPQIFSGSTYAVKVGYDKKLTDGLLSGDDIDDNPKREILGEYDVNTVGNYPLTYVVTDSSGNQTKKEFILQVKPKSTKTTTNEQTPTKKLEIAEVIKNHKTENTKIGIDVSKWQGEINWEEVKASGVEFAMIRLGYQTKYDGGYELDPYFIANIQGAKAVGLPVGVYFYSYARNVGQAKEQADWVKEKLKGYTLELPVAYDWESWSSFNQAQMSFFTLNQCAKVFLDTVQEAGYKGMLYSSKHYLEIMWKKPNYPVWLAQYNTRVTYEGDYAIWQMSDKGKVPGISGDVDLDVMYLKK